MRDVLKGRCDRTGVWVKYWSCQIVRLITTRRQRRIRPGIASKWQSWQLVADTTRALSHEHCQPTAFPKTDVPSSGRRYCGGLGRESGLGLDLVTHPQQTLAGEQIQRPRQERYQYYRLLCLILSLTFGALLLL